MRKYHKWAEEEKRWLKSHIKDFICFEKFTAAFNSAFDADLSKNAIIKCCGLLSLKMGTNSGQIRKGENSGQGFPLWTESIRTGKRGNQEVWVKISEAVQEAGVWKGKYNRNWRLKSRVIWEQHHGEIPKGSKIIFLDSNTLNCDISNLYCITNSTHMMMVQYGWYGKDREITLTAIKWCELNKTLKDIRRASVESPGSMTAK